MIKFYFKDKCNADFLQDHHNRDNECLIGVFACGQGGLGAVDQILDDIESRDNIPEWVMDDPGLRKLIGEVVDNVDFRPVDEDGNEMDEPDDPEGTVDYDHIIEESEAQCWFVLKWSKD